MVTVQPLALSMSPEYFHDAEVWHPERWLSEAETNPDSPYFHDCRKSVRAFGWGQHNCVGEPLAWAWMRLIIAKMLWTFDLQNSDTSNSKIDWDRQKVFGIIMKHRLDVFLVERIVRS